MFISSETNRVIFRCLAKHYFKEDHSYSQGLLTTPQFNLTNSPLDFTQIHFAQLHTTLPTHGSFRSITRTPHLTSQNCTENFRNNKTIASFSLFQQDGHKAETIDSSGFLDYMTFIRLETYTNHAYNFRIVYHN